MKSIFDATMLVNIPVRNRLIQSATWENMGDDKGHITSKLKDRLVRVAKGGVGMIFPGYAFVTKDEQPNPGMIGVYDDAFIPEYQDLTEAVHGHGAAIGLQIAYGGSCTTFKPEGRLIWGPSAVANPTTGITPAEMSNKDLAEIITAFAKAAGRAKAGGFDCVQLHGAHSYLLSQFLTPYFNRRTDAYGGSIANRARIIFEILEAVRQEVGDDFPIMIKIHGSDEMPRDGMTLEESIWVCKELARLGLDALEISGGYRSEDAATGAAKPQIRKQDKQSYFQTQAAAIASEIDIPVILVGGNREVEVMDSILNNTDICYFSLCRTLLSEAELPNTWRLKPNYIPRCLSCNQCFDEDGNVCLLDRKASMADQTEQN